jgi:integrase/recombinase XerD
MTMPTTNQEMSGPHRVEPRHVLNKGLDFPDGPECYGRPAAADCRRGGCALLVAAGLGSPARHALISLLALNGLRVSEATGADIEHLGLERGHRTLTVTRKGGKVVTIPLAPRTAQAIDLAIREQTEGPVFLARDGRRLDRHGVGRIVRKTARSAGITKLVTRTPCGTRSSPPRWMPGCRCGTCKRLPRMPIRGPRMRYDRARGGLDRHATYIVAAYLAGAAR